MAVIIDRVMDYQTKAENNFADLGTAYYTDPILRVAQAGVMQGDGKNVRPKANITRAEVVKLLDNMISDYITESGTATPKGTGIVIVKASGVTLNKAKLSSTVVLGGKAGEVKATDCEITGKVVKIHKLCSGDQRQHEYGRLDRWFFRRFLWRRLVCTGGTECIPAPQGTGNVQEPGRIQLRYDVCRYADRTGRCGHLLRNRGRQGQGACTDDQEQKV